MNSNRRVMVFTLGSITVYLMVSVIAAITGSSLGPFNKVNLVGDIFKSPAKKITPALPEDTVNIAPPVANKNIKHSDISLYKRSNLITNFNADTTQPSLENFLEKLKALKTGKKRKIRIGYFGDSMIEADLLTQTLRKLLQKEFGGSGVGFVPVTSQVSQWRTTASDFYSDGWQDENFKPPTTGSLFFSGHLFRGNGDWVEMGDRTITDSTALIEKSLLCGYVNQPVSISVNNAPLPLKANKKFNRIVLGKDLKRKIKIAVADERLPVYGISFESESGVIVDNFSFRGISGIELNKIDTGFLNAVNTDGPYYDLMIFQYGVNVLYHPNDINFGWYKSLFLPVIQKVKKYFPNTDVVMISTADRAFSYDGEYQSAKGIDSLIKVQADIAYQTGCTFYNQFATMGGKNSIVQWADAKPSLARKDYVHPNDRGCDVLATHFFDALMKDYNKYLTTNK
jgi:hypothetical protein